MIDLPRACAGVDAVSETVEPGSEPDAHVPIRAASPGGGELLGVHPSDLSFEHHEGLLVGVASWGF